ncbi:MAG: hypothetical protein HW421_3706 [Ignavibacteria bacterium]|nr:hypothetical protein [Ignavibacteria bacterium]
MKVFMKKILLILAIFLVANIVNAQQWVSKQPQNRNVVLEEFTGIHCGYCPDGHKRANDLVAANPGRVFLINVHAGGYAVPAAGEPDLRTPEGTAIDAAAQVSGYPAGSVNRSTTPWAKDRGQWASLATGIMNQASPVNVFVKSSVDFAKRELTTEVEVYYTGNSPKSTNYLTVVLTQDTMIGYQSDYNNYNPTNWTKDKKYYHNHVLRQVFSSGGTFGEAITTTTANSFITKKYTTILPDDITEEFLALNHLNVVAFVSEGQNNIYSGFGTEVEYDTQIKYGDLGLRNLTVPPTELFFTKISPKAEITNNSGKTVTSFDVFAVFNDISNKKTFSGSLANGEKTTIDWGEITCIPTGVYSIKIKGFSNINNNEFFDMEGSNNKYKYSGIGFTSKAFTEFSGGFNSTTLPPHCAFDQSKNTAFRVVTSTSNIGALSTKGTIQFSLHSSWNLSGKPADILIGEADLSTKEEKTFLNYYYAYSDGSRNGTAPKIIVSVSDDKGNSWVDLSTTTCIQTGNPPNANTYYVPTTSQYKTISTDLSEFKESPILIRVRSIPGTDGNALYIDEITVGKATTDVKDNLQSENFSLYPNPSTDAISFINLNLIGMDYSIYSAIGEIVAAGKNLNNNINISKLEPGAYYIKINTEIMKFIKH